MLISVSVALLLLASCRSQSDPIATQSPSSETVVSSTPPFQTREPDRYRAVRTITVVNAKGEPVVTRSVTARDGEMRRTESEVASKTVAYLVVPAGRFVLLTAEKVYAEVGVDGDAIATEEEVSPEGLLHTDVGSTTYQKMGTETIGGRNADKFRIVVNSSSAANVSQSETLIWIDQALHMPVRSETKSADGTRVTMELSEITLDVDKRLFEIPDGYDKITFIELHNHLQNRAR